jgi:hypothetical protein
MVIFPLSPLAGQANLFVGPVKKDNAKRMFQGLDLLADGGLGQKQLSGGPGKVECVGHFVKGFQMIRIHKISLWL